MSDISCDTSYCTEYRLGVWSVVKQTREPLAVAETEEAAKKIVKALNEAEGL